MEEAFNTIYDPKTMEPHSLFSNEGKLLLKALVSSSMSGGMQRVEQTNDPEKEEKQDAQNNIVMLNHNNYLIEYFVPWDNIHQKVGLFLGDLKSMSQMVSFF